MWEPPLPPIRTPGGSVEPPEDPEPQNPPATVKVEPLRRLSEIMPAPSLDERGNPVDWSPSFVVQERIGRIQIVVEGVDITYLSVDRLSFMLIGEVPDANALAAASDASWIACPAVVSLPISSRSMSPLRAVRA